MSGFVDEASLHVRGGDGGAGSVSFRREAHVPLGGPDGGDGGDGGDVWLVADRDVASLLAFRDHPHRRATDGRHGQGKRRHGATGASLYVSVPEGTVVRELSAEGAEAPVLADLVHAGDTWLAARGGRGGRGNARFLSNRRRAPSFAEQGERAEERWLRLELKLFADVALVGFPNAGKSTLVSRLSAARPKIGDYPFTTLQPHLGVVRRGSDGHAGSGGHGGGITEWVMADIPGLIEGASEGRGLGHEFLRHVERARVLLVLVDLAPADGRPAAEQERILLAELAGHRPELLVRPRLVVGTKADVAVQDFPGLCISAVTGVGLGELLGALDGLVAGARAAEPEARAFVVHRPEQAGVRVETAPDGTFRVLGREAERAVAVTDLTNADAMAWVHQRLRRLGVDRALARAGARDGDLVHIGGFTLTFEDDQGIRR